MLEQMVLFIISFVREYNYPSVQVMDDEEVLQVFNRCNRVFLLSWALSKLNNELYGYLAFNQKQKDIKNIIAKALNNHRVCFEDQSMQFVEGQLDYEKEVKIIYRLVKHIDTLQRSKNLSETPVEPVTLDEIHAIRRLDVNFFPYSVATDTLAEQSDLSDKFTECLKRVKDEQEQPSTKPQLNELPNIDQLEQIIQTIDKSLSLFNQTVCTVVRTEHPNSTIKFDFDSNLPNVLKKGVEDLLSVTQLAKNLNINVRGVGDIGIPENRTSHFEDGLIEYGDLLE